MPAPKTGSTTTDAMVADARAFYDAQIKVAKALGKLPDDDARRRALGAVIVMLGLGDVRVEAREEAALRAQVERS